jgi:hypothetical protein
MRRTQQTGSEWDDLTQSKSRNRISDASTSASVDSLPRLQRMHQDSSNSEEEFDSTEGFLGDMSWLEKNSFTKETSKTTSEKSENTHSDDTKFLMSTLRPVRT